MSQTDTDEEERGSREPEVDRTNPRTGGGRTGTADGDLESTLFWFSVMGAVILGLLWIIAVTGVFGLTWTVLGATTTLVIAIIAAIGAVLFWYDVRSAHRGATP